ncbi:hypothetical protein STXM2123_136 [Streptomyces sp. F-3]|nr:hypothetical protein STXM2123_136 [Streptomyces sp. F-3]
MGSSEYRASLAVFSHRPRRLWRGLGLTAALCDGWENLLPA